MFNTVRTKLTLSAGLVFVTLLAVFALGTSSVAKVSHISYTGMGDLHRFEARRFAPIAGMGDLQRFEGQAFAPDNDALESIQSYTGMGDLRRFEVEQMSKVLASERPYAGMGDLHRIESLP